MNDNLFKAILAMDSYNRGYDQGILLSGTALGNASVFRDSSIIKDAQGNRTDDDIGFYALAYTYNGETVISYRGTDYPDDGTIIPKDIKYGWTLGAGNTDSPQGLMAIQFYKDVANLAALPGSQNVYLDANISLTGHSLGGGLAGYVASLYKQDAKVFDSMDYDGGVVDTVLVTNPQGTDYDANLKTLIYGSSQPWSPNNSGITASNIKGEALGFIRLANSNSLGLGAGVDLGPIDKHSASLLVIRTFAETELSGVTDWQSAGKYFWPVLYDDAFAKSLNMGSVDNQTRQDGDYNSVLRDIIAYSAIDEGARIYGDTGIRAFYDDANDLGKAIAKKSALSTTPNISETYLTDISKVFVQFGGQLALNQVLYSSATASVLDGVLTFSEASNNNTLTINFTDSLWKLANNGVSMTSIVGRDGLIKDLLLNAADSVYSDMRTQWGSIVSGSSHSEMNASIDRVVFATLQTGASIISDNPTGKATLFVGGTGADNITGSNGRDLILGNAGGDQIHGGAGNDIFVAGRPAYSAGTSTATNYLYGDTLKVNSGPSSGGGLAGLAASNDNHRATKLRVAC